VYTTKNYRRWSAAIALFWIFLVLYPRPMALGDSIYRLIYPPVDAKAAESLIPLLPDPYDPEAIEIFVLKNIPYSYDWQAYDLPWYFPTVEEALQNKKGDCKTRFIVLASLFEALFIPYELYISPTHIWINYEGKQDNRIENLDSAVFYYDHSGKPAFKIPQIDWKGSVDAFWEAFWLHMPAPRKNALLSGLAFSAFLFIYKSKHLSGGVLTERKKTAQEKQQAVFDNAHQADRNLFH
jgi:hypothetical protein